MSSGASSARPGRAGSLVRPLVHQLHAYVPGEQPKVKGLIKLNTNENPYPPSPKVLAAIKAGVDGRLRLYPNPTAQPLREKLAKLHHCSPENIIVGNGSDELLALATRTFVEPQAGDRPARELVGVDVRDARAIGREVDDAPVGREHRPGVLRAVVRERVHLARLDVDHLDVAVAARAPAREHDRACVR